MRGFVRWLFWKACYLCRPTPCSLEEYLLWSERTRWPWKKFRPSVWHCEKMWHVYLTDERHFVSRRTLNLDVYVGEESGNIVGFDVWDKNLRNPWKKGASDE